MKGRQRSLPKPEILKRRARGRWCGERNVKVVGGWEKDERAGER